VTVDPRSPAHKPGPGSDRSAANEGPAAGADRKPPTLLQYFVAPVLFSIGALVGPAYYLYATAQEVVDANIGAGLAMMWTALWGLPWSIWTWNNPPGNNGTEEAIYTACALFNVVLVTLVMCWLRRRAIRATRQSAHL
jgi:hypothetical protein